MTDTEKVINGPAQKVEVPVEKVKTDAARDVVRTAEEQNEDSARQAFEATKATQKPVPVDASLSAADGSTNSVAGS